MKNSFLVTDSFVKAILSEAIPVRKTVSIRAVELKDAMIITSKEGRESGEAGDFLVIENGGAEAGYLIKGELFHQMYECTEDDCYQKRDICYAYLMDKPFSVVPVWNEGEALHSSNDGGYLMIYGNEDYNICSFEDFEKTYQFV